jgi:protoporphyrinogen oxidase
VRLFVGRDRTRGDRRPFEGRGAENEGFVSDPFVVLGGGPAGLGAAYKLALRGEPVVLFEAGADVGGHAGSFEIDGHRVDYGSHRLHPSTPPEVMADIRALLGDALLDRPRHGRIRLLGRWLHFPLKPADLLLHAPPTFVLGVLRDGAGKIFSKLFGGGRAVANATGGDETFASVLEAGLGSTICRHFYFPYAIKMWGAEAKELSPIQAKKRVSAGSIGKLVRRVLGALPGLRAPGQGRFFYPRDGFGSIAGAYRRAAEAKGAVVETNARVVALLREGATVVGVRVATPSGEKTVRARHVLSTIPIKAVVAAASPAAPPDVVAAADRIALRSLMLVYLVLPVPRFTEYDAHYFPGVDIPFTRLSEPKNYPARSTPEGTTVLCAEMPCSTNDAAWSADDASLGRMVEDGLKRCGIPLPAAPTKIVVKRAKDAYPIYANGYEKDVDATEAFLSGLDRFTFFGRQGLFAHDNTHHALRMAYAAVSSLSPDGRRDDAAWAARREEFKAHVVED